jgi:polyphosphate kinase
LSPKEPQEPDLSPAETFINRELSWLRFARRVLALAENPDLPLLERIKFAGIVGMLHDEFYMKRVSGLKRQIARQSSSRSIDDKLPVEQYQACRKELIGQTKVLTRVIRKELRPALKQQGIPILDHDQLDSQDAEHIREYFQRSVQPILTPLAVDAEHPFPFISGGGLNLAIIVPEEKRGRERFVRLKVPDNRPRWVPLPEGRGFVPLEQVIAANMDLVFPSQSVKTVHVFRVTRGAEGDLDDTAGLSPDDALSEPGSIVQQVTRELKARRFAGVVRLQVDASMPKKLMSWLGTQLDVAKSDIYPTAGLLGVSNLAGLETPEHARLGLPPHLPVSHRRLRDLDPDDPAAIFKEMARGDILLHHPYQSFDTSVLNFLRSAAVDPAVLAIKLTIYRTSKDSPIVLALAEAARRGKQVAVLVEITARFDEAPNIAWGEFLEKEGVHVAYGVEQLKTHVKLALVVREEHGEVRRYLHAGTGNYHTGTARVYEDLGVLTCDPDLCDDAAAVFNALTGATVRSSYRKMIVAPSEMRRRFTEMIRREAEHAEHGRPSGIRAKMNQLQDPSIIRELYAASRVGVPIELNVRGLCCLRPGVPGLSETIRVFGVVGRFLEHSRIYCFTNGGDPEYYIGSADWMRRNLDRRFETVVPILDEANQRELDEILATYTDDNSSVWDCGSDGRYVRRSPGDGEEPFAAQEALIRRATVGTTPAPATMEAAPS